MLVKESISFERGGNPKKILGIGDEHNLYRKTILRALKEIIDSEKLNTKIEIEENTKTCFRAAIDLPNDKVGYYIQYTKDCFDVGRVDFEEWDVIVDYEDTIEGSINRIKDWLKQDINESLSFKRGEDPKEMLGIGVFSPKSFNSIYEAVNYLIMVLPGILHTEKIPEDIVKIDKNAAGHTSVWFSWKYYKTIARYIEKYIINYENNDVCILLHDELIKKGYKQR